MAEISAINKQRKKELKNELKKLKEYREIYQKLVEIGESQVKTAKELKAKLAQYRKRKDEIESRISLIEKLLED